MNTLNTLHNLIKQYVETHPNPEVQNDLGLFLDWVAENPTPAKQTRPGQGTITGKVWDLADEVTKTSGSKATRKAVLEAGRVLGINDSTILTQYQKWSVQYNPTHTVEVKVDPEVVVHPE